MSNPETSALKTLRARLLTVDLPLMADDATPNVHWHMERFTPADGLPYVQEALVLGRADIAAFGGGVSSCEITQSGIYYLTLYHPIREQATYYEAQEARAKMLNAFRPGERLFMAAAGGPYIDVGYVEPMAPRNETDWRVLGSAMGLTLRYSNNAWQE